MASTASVAFTINHIAAVIVPVSFGLLWLISPAAVFLSGAAMAGISLLLSLNVPRLIPKQALKLCCHQSRLGSVWQNSLTAYLTCLDFEGLI